jgi:hypothetical protein
MEPSNMLGPLGPIANNYLRSKGFVITRPTRIEKQFSRGFWKNWFANDPVLFSSVYAKNRETLSSISTWVTDETLAGSLWRYGVPLEWSESYHDAIDSTGLNDIESEITASDILAFAARRLGDGVSYLEIGVSVGKNLIQIERQIQDSCLVGLDIEELNPTLRSQFKDCVYVGERSEAYEVETLTGEKAKKRTTLQKMTSANNTFEYLSGDQFRADTWERLAGRKFNLIFSDGVHTADALRSEFHFLQKYNLIDRERCVVFWDDLQHPEMQSVFLDNARALCNIFGRTDDAISLFKLHGSYGMQRPMGMFSSL